LKSILEQNSLDEFVTLAEMSQKQFTAERGGDAYEMVANNAIIPNVNTTDSLKQVTGLINKFLNEDSVNRPAYRPLKIPRRPKWSKEQTSHEINV